MTHWQKSSPRQAPRSKAELREMLTEAVRNTRPVPNRNPAKATTIAEDPSISNQAFKVLPAVR
ncbi:hypothetical protein GCM10007858_22240 [Bradyrhizobium liaoningense]|nr:hypothetical protein GCM10007858_22240 [Bradyrhizobium liaoningense]